MKTQILQIPLAQLLPHPDSPNRMSRGNFGKLVRNIERTGRYEPLVVRPCPGRPGFFQIINGHQRYAALRQLGRPTADAVVWDVNEEQTDLLLATLNRLGGRDTLDKKLALFRRLSTGASLRTLAQRLPQTRGQLERLVNGRPPAQPAERRRAVFAVPVVFFVDRGQAGIVEEALTQVTAGRPRSQTRAATRAAALTLLARSFLEHRDTAPAAAAGSSP